MLYVVLGDPKQAFKFISVYYLLFNNAEKLTVTVGLNCWKFGFGKNKNVGNLWKYSNV